MDNSDDDSSHLHTPSQQYLKGRGVTRMEIDSRYADLAGEQGQGERLTQDVKETNLKREMNQVDDGNGDVTVVNIQDIAKKFYDYPGDDEGLDVNIIGLDENDERDSDYKAVVFHKNNVEDDDGWDKTDELLGYEDLAENGEDEMGDESFDDMNDEDSDKNGNELIQEDSPVNEDGPSNEKPALQSSDIRKLILLTYMRSGSTFMGDLIKQAPEVHYIFEPLYSIQKDYSGGRDLHYLHKEPVLQLNPDDFYQPYSLSVDTVKAFLDCRTQDVDLGTLRSKFMASSRSTRGLLRCMQNAEKDEEIQVCTDEHTSECLTTSVTSVKVIRFTMKQARVLLEEDPAVRILHLIRDPRGMLNSQARYRFHWDKLRPESQSFCARISEDLTEHAKLATAFPNRTLLVRYEDIVLSPLESLTQIYAFLGIKLTDMIKDYVLGKTTDKERPFHWRQDLSSEYVSIIDEHCKELCTFMGYRPFSEEEQSDEALSPVEPKFAAGSLINKVVVGS